MLVILLTTIKQYFQFLVVIISYITNVGDIFPNLELDFCFRNPEMSFFPCTYFAMIFKNSILELFLKPSSVSFFNFENTFPI